MPGSVSVFSCLAALASAALSQPVIDGSLAGDEGYYGPPVWVQILGTTAGSNMDPSRDSADGSELDALYAYFDLQGGMLYLFIAGNLQPDAASLDLFLDVGVGGQNRLKSNNATIDNDGLNRMGPVFDGMGVQLSPGLKFDAGFTPDYFVTYAARTLNPPFVTHEAHAAVLRTGGDPDNLFGAMIAAVDKPARVEGVGPNGGTIIIDCDNSNTLGVGGLGEPDESDPASVATGIELALPLSEIGYDGVRTQLSVLAVINGQGHSLLTNQFSATLPSATPALGDPSALDLTTITGDQRVKPSIACALADVNASGGASTSDVLMYLLDWFPALDPRADLNADGAVDVHDAMLFADAYSRCLGFSTDAPTSPSMTITMTHNLPANKRISPGATVHLDLEAAWTPASLGAAGMMFELLNVRGAEMNSALSYATPTGLDDAAAEPVVTENGEILGCELWQIMRYYNNEFLFDNPADLGRITWKAPSIVDEPYDVTVRLEPTLAGVYLHERGATARYPVMPQVTNPAATDATGELTWTVKATPCPVDVNGDRFVDDGDLFWVLHGLHADWPIVNSGASSTIDGGAGSVTGEEPSDFNSPGGPHNAKGDVNGDGVVNQKDLAIVCADWHQPCFAAPCYQGGTATYSLVRVANEAGAGDPTHPEFDPAIHHFTYELRVTLTGDEAWTTGDATITLTREGAELFIHDLSPGDGTPPSWQDLADFPALTYTAFVTGARAIASEQTGAPQTRTVRFEHEPQNIKVMWYEPLEPTPNCGEHTVPDTPRALTIARFTVVTSGNICGAMGTITGKGTRAASSTLTSFSFNIGIAGDAELGPVCKCDINADHVVDELDPPAFMAAYAAQQSSADINEDGVVNSIDVSRFVELYSLIY